jgi:hypothetical protein
MQNIVKKESMALFISNFFPRTRIVLTTLRSRYVTDFEIRLYFNEEHLFSFERYMSLVEAYEYSYTSGKTKRLSVARSGTGRTSNPPGIIQFPTIFLNGSLDKNEH